MRCDAFAVSVTDARGRVLAASDAHCALLQREKSDVVGRYWSEWTPSKDVPRLQSAFDRCLAGETLSTRRCIVGKNGLMTTVSTQVLALGSNGHRNVIAVSLPLYDNDEVISSRSASLLDYILDLSAELAQLADRSGLYRLGSLLDDVKREAETIMAIAGSLVSTGH